jgi:V/A-type H+-transporting ATPase subunit A
MMKVVGKEGPPSEDYIIYQTGELLDSVYLQQNSFDPIDAACEPERQRKEFARLYDAMMRTYDITDKREIRGFFNQLRQEFLDWHGTMTDSPEFVEQEQKITDFYTSRAID